MNREYIKGNRRNYDKNIYLITVYPKKAKDNLSKEERNEIKKVIEALKKSLGDE